MHVQIEFVDEHDGLSVAGRMLKSRIGLSQSTGEVDQHGQEPALAIGELAQVERLTALVYHKPGLVTTFYPHVEKFTEKRRECLFNGLIGACRPSVSLFEHGFLAPQQGSLAKTQLAVFECFGIRGAESACRPRLARATL